MRIFFEKILLTGEALPGAKMEKLPRHSTDEQRSALKSATRRALKIAAGKAFSLVTRVGAPTLSEYGSVGQPKDFMPIDVLLDLQGEYPEGQPSPLLEELAQLCGFKLVPVDCGDEGDGVRVDNVQSMIREGGEAKAAALEAVDTGCIDVVRKARREVAEGKAAFAHVGRALARHERRLLRRGAA